MEAEEDSFSLFLKYGRRCSHFAELETVIVGVAVVTVKIVVAHSDVGAGRAVAQGDAADAATKAVDVIKETQTFDDHGRTST